MEPEKAGWWGCLEVEKGDEEVQIVRSTEKGKGRAVDEVLRVNGKLIEELQAWQEVRVRKGDEAWIPQREQRVGECGISPCLFGLM